VVNWYGPRKEFEDQAYGLMQQAASADPSFKVAAQYDEAVDHPGYDTDAVIVDLQYLYDRTLGRKRAFALCLPALQRASGDLYFSQGIQH
jgi:hypothetical protein